MPKDTTQRLQGQARDVLGIGCLACKCWDYSSRICTIILVMSYLKIAHIFTVTHRRIERYKFIRQFQSNWKGRIMDGILGEIHKVLADPALDFVASTALSIILAQRSTNGKEKNTIQVKDNDSITART